MTQTTSLETKFLSGGYSIQRNEMITIPQIQHRQRFQFMNEFNQTFARFNKPAQGLGQGAQRQIDRIPAYEISSEKREIVNGVISSVKKPLTYKYAVGDIKAQIGSIELSSTGEILSIGLANGGSGYAPSTEFAVCIRGGQTGEKTPVPASIKCKSNGDGAITVFEIVNGGSNYTLAGDSGNNYPPLTMQIDESPMLGQFCVTRFNGEEQSTGVGAITSLVLPATGLSGHRPGIWFVQHRPAKGFSLTTTSTAGKLNLLEFQVYVNDEGIINKLNLTKYSEDFVVGDTVTIPQSCLGGIKDDQADVNDVVFTVGTVTDQEQVDRDFGTAIWQSETFSAGVDVVMIYTIDTNIDIETTDGFMRTLATDLCLHPYANYYSSAWSTVEQRTATLTFTGSLVNAASHVDIIATLTDQETGDVLTAAQGFQESDIGKRIIEPYGSGTVVITGIGGVAPNESVVAGAAVCSIATLSGALKRSNEDVNTWEQSSRLIYKRDRWRLSIDRLKKADHTGGFESQPYNLIYPRITDGAGDHITIRDNGQQNHRDVMTAIRRIGDLFVVESEKATDLLSSKNDINQATSSVPTTVHLTQPVRDQRKPQKWRMRFYYDKRDEYLYINVATPLQILDNGNLTSGQGRDGIKGSVFRQPGELSEIYYNFKSDQNKAKSGFFRRQGKTDSGIDASYPMAYRLTCTDHGTGFFLYDQASVDQDDDYAWFVVQRHVNNVSGAIESEDGKSPVHCLYSPSKRPEETSDFNMGYYAEVSSQMDPATGVTTMTSKNLGELEIFDINGRKLKPGIPLQQTIVTSGMPVMARHSAYSNGNLYATSPATGGIPLLDHAGLGTDLTSGYTNVNDFMQFPALIDANYASLTLTNLNGTAVIAEVGATPGPASPAYYGYNLAFGQNVGSTFVPVGDFISDQLAATRYSDTTPGLSSSAGTFTKAYGAALDPVIEHFGLKNYVSARNQMQGPTKLGLKLHKVRHRTAEGFDTILDVDDIAIINRAEIVARTDANGDPREYPISSAVAVFKPTSSAAQKLVRERRVKVIYFEHITFESDGTADNTNLIAPNVPVEADMTADEQAHYKNATWDFSQSVEAITELGTEAAPIANDLIINANAEIVPISGFPIKGGRTAGFHAHLNMKTTTLSPTQKTGVGSFSTRPGDQYSSGIQIPMEVGDLITLKKWNDDTGNLVATNTLAPAQKPGAKVTGVIDTFPEGDMFIYEYAWEGAGHEYEYTNYYGRSGIGSNPLFEVNRLKVFVDGQEADAAVLGQNYIINQEGQIEFGDTTSSLEYFGTEKPIFAYNMLNDKLKFALPIEDGTVVKLSYENYSDVEERDTGKSTYLIKIPEDRDMPNIWNDIHKVSKGIYRFIVRESDVLKPWDYHVSAVIPQVDSPPCINPVEQLSITQDKTVIFNFPTPLASQRFIYSDAEADIICIAGADSSTQGGIIKTSDAKFDLDAYQHSGYRNNHDDPNISLSDTQHGRAGGLATDVGVSTSSNGDVLNFRREYSWHSVYQGTIDAGTGLRTGATTSPTVVAFDTPDNATHRTYLGMMSTKPYGNGMRIFIHCRGGSIRPDYTDYTPRDQVDSANNTFV